MAAEVGLAKFRDEFDRLFGRVFGNLEPLEISRPSPFYPSIDVLNRKNDVLIRVELPGMKAEELDLKCEQSTLTLSGKKKEAEREKDVGLFRDECSYGKFHRVIDLPADVEPNSAQAVLKNGVLEVVLSKTAESKQREVKIKIA